MELASIAPRNAPSHRRSLEDRLKACPLIFREGSTGHSSCGCVGSYESCHQFCPFQNTFVQRTYLKRGLLNTHRKVMQDRRARFMHVLRPFTVQNFDFGEGRRGVLGLAWLRPWPICNSLAGTGNSRSVLQGSSPRDVRVKTLNPGPVTVGLS